MALVSRVHRGPGGGRRTRAPSMAGRRGETALGHGAVGPISFWPAVLKKLPGSCAKVFGILVLSAEGGTVAMPLRLLAARAGISVTQARRALKRLAAAKLIEIAEPGRGRRATVFRLRWRLRSFPQPFVPSSPAPPFQRNRKRTPAETTAPPRGAAWSEFPIKSKSSALRWAMFRLRREVQRWALPPPRRENLLRGLGNAVWRALRKGLVRTTTQLRRLLHELLGHLRDAPAGVSASLRRACGYAGAITLMGLRAIGALPRHNPVPPGRVSRSSFTEYIHRRLSHLGACGG